MILVRLKLEIVNKQVGCRIYSNLFRFLISWGFVTKHAEDDKSAGVTKYIATIWVLIDLLLYTESFHLLLLT